MAVAYKILGQKQPATAYQVLYKVPITPDNVFGSRGVRRAVVSNITICNFSLTVDRGYYIRVVPNGETAADKHILFENKEIGTTDIHFLPVKIMLEGGDEVQVKLNGSAVVAISAFGFEVF